MTTSHPDLDRVRRYVTGDLPDTDRADTLAWIQDDPDRVQLHEELDEVWQLGARLTPPVDLESARRRAMEITRGEGARSGRTHPARSTPSIGGRYWLALSAVGLAAAAVFTLGPKHGGNTKIASSVAPTTYTTRAGERATLTLRDGSRVTLGPATTLRVLESDAADAPTSVHVAGEAYFAVHGAATRPFVVSAQGVTTRVLGTEFVVRAYEASGVRVAVRAGRVSVQTPAVTATNAVVVNAGYAVSVASDAVATMSRLSDPASDFAWTEGQLVLRDLPLGDALVRLSRWYGMEFRVADTSLLALRVETNLPAAFNRDRIDGLANVLGARVTYTGAAVVFSRP